MAEDTHDSDTGADGGGAEASADVRQMSFEDALAELRKIVERLEKGEGRLDEAIKAYERGAELKAHCERKLKEAEARIEKIRVGEAGDRSDIGSEPLDVD